MTKNDEQIADYLGKLIVGIFAAYGLATAGAHLYENLAQDVNAYVDGRIHIQIWALRDEMYTNLQALHPSRVLCGRHGCYIAEVEK